MLNAPSFLNNNRTVAAGLLSSLVALSCYLVAPQVGIAPVTGLTIGYGLAGFPYIFIALRLINDTKEQPRLSVILWGTVLSRLILIWVPPLLSEDVWRYLWDGEVLLSGLNPYAYAPADSALDSFTHEHDLNSMRAQIGHSHIPTVYPPTAQITFLFSTLLGGSVIGFRLIAIVADTVCVWCLWRWLNHRKMNPKRVVLYAFCPVSIIETSIGTHIDAIGVAFLVAGLLAATHHQNLRAGISIAWAAGIKIVPILVCIPLWFFRRKVSVLTVVTISTITLLFFLHYDGGPRGLTSFAQRWRGNDGLFALIYGIGDSCWPNDGRPINVGQTLASLFGYLSGKTPGTPEHLIWPNELVFALTKLICGAILVGVLIRSTWTRQTTIRFWMNAMGTLLLVSPVVHPWYLLWVLPFVVLYEGKAVPILKDPFIVWSCTIWLAYWPKVSYELTGIWSESDLLKSLQYLPVFVLLAIRWVTREPQKGHSA